MSYLLDFYITCTDEEKNIFYFLDLKGKEELIRDEFYKNALSSNFNENNLPKNYQLSQLHFDKIVSVLLTKLLKAIYNDSIEKMYASILQKGLTNLLIHLIKIHERKLKLINNNDEKAEFYRIVFETYCSMFHPLYNSKLTHQYGKKYLDLLGQNRTFDNLIYVNFQMHYADMLAQYFAGNEDKYRNKAFQFFNKWEIEINLTKSNFAIFFYNFIKAAAIKFYGSDVNEFNDLLIRAITNLKKCNKQTQNKYLFKSYCELGFGNIESGQFDKAFTIYRKAFNLDTKSINSSSYTAATYFNVCVLTNHLNEANEVYDRYLKKYLTKGINKSVQFDILLNVFIFHLYAKNYSTAFEFLNQLKSFKRNDITPIAQVLIRLSENLYFYTTEDYKMATLLSKRNKKYLSRPENRNDQYTYFLNFFSCLYLFSQQKEQQINISNDSLFQKSQLKKGMYELFNNLLI